MARVLLSATGKRLGVVLGAGILIYGAGFLLLGYVMRLPRFQIDTATLSIVDRPSWMPERVANEIRVPEELAGRYSVFDPRLVHDVAVGLGASPWVRRVREVRRVYPHSITIALDLRRPVATALSGGVYFLVDREGVVLPGVDPQEGEFGGILPTIQGTAGEPPLPGGVWADQGVKEGATVADIVQGSELLTAVRIVQIDVSNVAGRVDPVAGEITLRTAGGTRIVWGRTDLSDRVKISSARRLEILESNLSAGLLAAHPGLEGISEIEVQFGRPIVRR